MKSLSEKIDARLNNPIVNEIKLLLATPANGFDSQSALKQHLAEGALLNINKLSSSVLSIPCGEYIVWTAPADFTTLVPTKSLNAELYEANTEQYDVLTKDILKNWNTIERTLVEEAPPHMADKGGEESNSNLGHNLDRETGKFQSKIQMSTVDRHPIARAMENLNISVTDLATQCGVDPPAISRILRKPRGGAGDPGGRNPSMELASKICSVLRLDPKAAFPDFFKVDTAHKARQTPGNRGSGMSQHAAGTRKKGAASAKWTQGSTGEA